jgi:GH15 family glucan-1,4-alpha-glucosidase
VPSISDYALLGDCQSAALVSRDGSVDWWCPARFDSRSVFGRILDPGAGHFSIRPAGAYEISRAYVESTMVVCTTFTTTGGVLRLTDALALEPGARGHEIGFRSPHVLLRLVEVVSGEIELEVEWAPRPEYGLVVPELEQVPEGLRSVGGPDSLVLATDLALEVDRGTARAGVTLGAGQRLELALHHLPGLARRDIGPLRPAEALGDTAEAWRSWAGEHQRYEGPYREHVERSSLVLQALTYAPSGAIVAAPTTSLPEIAGGEANWDYRFAWLRDASLTLRALWVAACPTEAQRYFEWMAAAVGLDPDSHVQIMFGVEGERDLSERELEHLAGHLGSRPVRVGNEAWRQRQLDVMGEVLDGAHVLREQLGELEPRVARFLCSMADRAAAEWTDTDAGIWEGREGERHYTSSKLFCWVALDRAVSLAPLLGDGARPVEWAATRDEIRDAILDQAWCEERNAYGGAFGSDRLDASVLLMPIMGIVDAGEERMRATIDAIDEELGDGGLVRRWTGSTEDEGAFVICSFWLANCLARAGEVERARTVFETVLAHANDVGLLSEEIDPRDGSLLGNFPQAFSHVGLINAAWAIDQASREVAA